MKTSINTILHYYSFDISKDGDKSAYKELTAKLKGMGLKVFDVISGRNYTEERDFWKTIEGRNEKTVSLETEHLFDNQWNPGPMGEYAPNGMRLHDWYEEVYPNRKIKQGYWLEQTEEMTRLRNEVYKCGYCGHSFHLPKEKYCLNCLGDQYLKEENLPLLLLVPVSQERNFKDQTIPKEIMDLYNERQKVERTRRLAKKQMEALEELENDKKNALIEYEGKSILINAGFDFDNIIYYNHTKTFCFGWREKLEPSIAETIQEKLKEMKFPYPIEFKTY